MNSHFTASVTWRGGFYELLIQPNKGSSEEVCSLLKAAWSSSVLDGCYKERESEPSLQVKVRPCEQAIAGHLYGLATLPNGSVVACGSYAADYRGEEGMDPARWVSFYLPLGALSTVCDIGAYPFGSMEKVSEWKIPIDTFLLELGRWIFARVPFEYALIGFEAMPSPSALQKLRNGDVPAERDNGILWNDSGTLKWYPATRP